MRRPHGGRSDASQRRSARGPEGPPSAPATRVPQKLTLSLSSDSAASPRDSRMSHFGASFPHVNPQSLSPSAPRAHERRRPAKSRVRDPEWSRPVRGDMGIRQTAKVFSPSGGCPRLQFLIHPLLNTRERGGRSRRRESLGKVKGCCLWWRRLTTSRSSENIASNRWIRSGTSWLSTLRTRRSASRP